MCHLNDQRQNAEQLAVRTVSSLLPCFLLHTLVPCCPFSFGCVCFSLPCVKSFLVRVSHAHTRVHCVLRIACTTMWLPYVYTLLSSSVSPCGAYVLGYNVTPQHGFPSVEYDSILPHSDILNNNNNNTAPLPAAHYNSTPLDTSRLLAAHDAYMSRTQTQPSLLFETPLPGEDASPIPRAVYHHHLSSEGSSPSAHPWYGTGPISRIRDSHKPQTYTTSSFHHIYDSLWNEMTYYFGLTRPCYRRNNRRSDRDAMLNARRRARRIRRDPNTYKGEDDSFFDFPLAPLRLIAHAILFFACMHALTIMYMLLAYMISHHALIAIPLLFAPKRADKFTLLFLATRRFACGAAW